MSKYSFLRDKEGNVWAYKCVCGKVSSLLELELAKFDTGLTQGKCPYCIKQKAGE